MDNKFIELMEERSDSELLEIVTKLRDDYQPEAIEAAELEIKKETYLLTKLNKLNKSLRR